MLAALSLAVLYALGLGLLAAGPALRALSSASAAKTPSQLCAGVAGVLALGLLADQLLVLTLHSLPVALSVGTVGAVLGLALGLRTALRSARESAAAVDSEASFVPLFALPVALVVAAYAVLILTQPLKHWDARSIWFFQAKIVYFAGGLYADSPWGALDFAHADYPKLLPLLAAQVAGFAGYWNETLPKAALLALLVPAAIGYTAFLERPASALFLIAMVFFPTYTELWNGYADGPLALYAGLAALGLGRWLDRRRPADGLLGIAALGIAASLKNEGALLGVALALGVVAAAATTRGRRVDTESRIRNRGPVVWLVALSLAGPVVWTVTKLAWGLSSDVAPSSTTVAAAWARLSESGALPSVLRSLFVTHELIGALVPLLLALIASVVLRVRTPVAFRLSLVTASLYLAGIVLVYLGTPHDLAWHLETSAGRTVLPIFVLFAAATYALLDAIERPPTAARAGSGE